MKLWFLGTLAVFARAMRIAGQRGPGQEKRVVGVSTADTCSHGERSGSSVGLFALAALPQWLTSNLNYVLFAKLVSSPFTKGVRH